MAGGGNEPRVCRGRLMGDFEIHTDIDLHDVQGNIIKGYGRYGFPVARYIFYRVTTERAGRDFVGRLLPMITSSAPWTQYGDVTRGTKKPSVTTNIAFTYEGLKQLAIPEQSLHSFPEEFTMGMRARTAILGDNGRSAPDAWDRSGARSPRRRWCMCSCRSMPCRAKRSNSGTER